MAFFLRVTSQVSNERSVDTPQPTFFAPGPYHPAMTFVNRSQCGLRLMTRLFLLGHLI